MSGFDNDIMYAKNSDYTQADNQNVSESNGLVTNGQMWIGSTALNAGGTHINVGNIVSSDSSITISYVSPNLNLITNGSIVGRTITGNSGGALVPTAGNWNTLGTGSITIAGSGSTLTTQLTGLTNHAVLVGAGTATITKLTVGTNGQVLIGATTADPAFATLTSSDSSITFTTGANTLSLQVAGGATVGKTITGTSGGAISPSSGNWNILGQDGITTAGSGSTITITPRGVGSGNMFLGEGAGNLTVSGTNNIAYGKVSLTAISSGSSNIAIGVQAMQTATGSTNTAVGAAAMSSAASTTNNIAIGPQALQNISGNSNVAVGAAAMSSAAGASTCVALGEQALQNASGSNNVAVGRQALINVASGASNIGLGTAAGSNLSTTDANNIMIGTIGTAGDNAKISIGTNGTHTTFFAQGISGVTVTGTAVLCSTAGQLGTIASSIRYKENVQPMPEDISVLHLSPVVFNYKTDESKLTQYGLIAEDVDVKFPYLCFYNEKKEPESVKYHELCVFLLHEVKKLEARVKGLERNPIG